MDKIYSIVFQKDREKILALCLENGITSQGDTKPLALKSIKDAIFSIEEAISEDDNILQNPVSIAELHEFLQFNNKIKNNVTYELEAMYV